MTTRTESLRHNWTYEHMNSQQLGSMHKSVQDQAITNPNTERGIGHEVPHLSEELLAIVSGWKRKSQFSQRLKIL